MSACETAIGSVDIYGNSSLSKQFIESGVGNVIGTLWPVDDIITKKFMTLFYKNLVTTSNINDSLILTKKEIQKEYNHPYYWAAFVLL